MSLRGPYRRYAPEFKIQLCQDIGSGAIGRRDAAKKHTLSTNLNELWLTQSDRGELCFLVSVILLADGLSAI